MRKLILTKCKHNANTILIPAKNFIKQLSADDIEDDSGAAFQGIEIGDTTFRIYVNIDDNKYEICVEYQQSGKYKQVAGLKWAQLTNNNTRDNEGHGYGQDINKWRDNDNNYRLKLVKDFI